MKKPNLKLFQKNKNQSFCASCKDDFIGCPEEMREEILNLLDSIPNIRSEDYRKMIQRLNKLQEYNINYQ